MVATELGRMVDAGYWKKYGPYSIVVNDGVLNFDFVANFGRAQVMAVSIASA